jgi:hypothetical protein
MNMKLLHHARPNLAPIDVRLEPAYNALNSLALLNVVGKTPSMDAWVAATAEALSPAELRENHLLLGLLGAALVFQGEWPDFPAYLEALARQVPSTLRDRAQAGIHPNNEALHLLDEAEILLADPSELQRRALRHLLQMWDTYLGPEWQRVASDLDHHVKGIAYHVRDHPETFANNLHLLVDDAVLTATPQGTRVQAIVLVPSPHVGRHIAHVYREETLYLFYSAPRNFATLGRSQPIGRKELLLRIEALADETRLQILEMFATRDELTAQDVQERLGLTQSTASRQIRGLSHFIVERRGEGANKRYQLSQGQFDMTFRALKGLIAEPQAEGLDLRHEAGDVRRFMDRRGRITVFPARPRDKLLVLEYLAEQIELGRSYSEKEITEHLRRQLAFDDAVTIRRELYNMLLIDRERDGSRYWRIDPQRREELLHGVRES